jgi:hypothetical protein
MDEQSWNETLARHHEQRRREGIAKAREILERTKPSTESSKPSLWHHGQTQQDIRHAKNEERLQRYVNGDRQALDGYDDDDDGGWMHSLLGPWGRKESIEETTMEKATPFNRPMVLRDGKATYVESSAPDPTASPIATGGTLTLNASDRAALNEWFQNCFLKQFEFKTSWFRNDWFPEFFGPMRDRINRNFDKAFDTIHKTEDDVAKLRKEITDIELKLRADHAVEIAKLKKEFAAKVLKARKEFGARGTNTNVIDLPRKQQ